MKYELKAAIEDLKNDKWLYYSTDDEGNIDFVEDDESVELAAKSWKMSQQAVRDIKGSLESLVESIVDAVYSDLEDIWNETQK